MCPPEYSESTPGAASPERRRPERGHDNCHELRAAMRLWRNLQSCLWTAMHRYHVSQHEPEPLNWWPMMLAAPIVFVPLAMLGAFYSYYVYTAVVFINYAACIIPWAVEGERRRTARYTTMLVGVLFAIGLRMPDPDLRNWYWLVIPTFCITCAAFFSWVVRTCLDLNQFAKIAERERIARDLHD